MIPATIIDAARLGCAEDQVDLNRFSRHFLAEGDSWFSFGSVLGSGLLHRLKFPDAVLITNLAEPGDTLELMVQWRARKLQQLVDGRRAEAFDAILLSAGGNDLIAALPWLLHAGKTLSDCIDEAAWQRFAVYLRANFAELSAMVATSSHNRGTPIFVHTYDLPTPRPAPALIGVGPWIYPHLRDIDPVLWRALVGWLMGRLGGLLSTLELPNVRVIHTFGTCVPAEPGATGLSGDWINEIHPSSKGYEKLCRQWEAALSGVA